MSKRQDGYGDADMKPFYMPPIGDKVRVPRGMSAKNISEYKGYINFWDSYTSAEEVNINTITNGKVYYLSLGNGFPGGMVEAKLVDDKIKLLPLQGHANGFTDRTIYLFEENFNPVYGTLYEPIPTSTGGRKKTKQHKKKSKKSKKTKRSRK